jgi:hypothetical protein
MLTAVQVPAGVAVVRSEPAVGWTLIVTACGSMASAALKQGLLLLSLAQVQPGAGGAPSAIGVRYG